MFYPESKRNPTFFSLFWRLLIDAPKIVYNFWLTKIRRMDYCLCVANVTVYSVACNRFLGGSMGTDSP